MMKVVVVSTHSGEENSLLGDVIEEAETRDEVVELNELVTALVSSLSKSIAHESRLQIELGGSIKLSGSAEAGVKFLCFNMGVSGEAERVNSLKLLLETKIVPEPV